MNIFSPFNNLYPIVAKTFSKIFFVPFNSDGNKTSPLVTFAPPPSRGGKGGGDAFRDFYATFSCENPRPNCFHP
jgi:hypothetical protein